MKNATREEHMNLKFAKKSIAVTVLGLFLGSAAFGASPPSVNDSAPTTGENWRSIQIASDKLEELRAVSGKLSLVGDSMHASMRSLQSARDGHAYRLNAARDHVNEAGRLLADLQGMYPELAPWQQQAIKTITPIASQIAAHTEAAIVHLNERPSARLAPVYTGHLQGIVEQSNSMRATVGDFLEYADAKSRVQMLETTLEI
jgi:hypothetical protein